MTSSVEHDRAAAVRGDTAQAVRYFFAKPTVTSVWLFGSAAKGRRLDWRSDLDFAVEGLDPLEHARAWSELDQMLTRTPDVVRWEEASETLRGEILAYGALIYEKA